MFKRSLSKTLPSTTFFLFGPRQTGKSTLLNELNPDLTINLLNPEEQLRYNKNPNILENQIEALKENSTIFIDEVQRVPKLLDIIHLLMESKKTLTFILCGSSARKLRHGAANLLGGRALYRNLHPLTFEELGTSFNLESVLSFGSLPKIYSFLIKKDVAQAQDYLRSYVITYLREEIKAEALVRNLQGFQNFLDVAVNQYSEQINFSALSRDCQIALSTEKEYYSILEDTLIGFFLKPYLKSERKRMSHQPKFYFFDNGVTRALLGTLRDAPTPQERGRLFEQWIIQEIVRINDYQQKDWKLSFWRTSHGAEVDLIISRGANILFAIECKSGKNPSSPEISGLKSFNEKNPEVPCFIVSPIKNPYKITFVHVVSPQQLFNTIINE